MQRTLKSFRENGFVRNLDYGVVERWIPGANIKEDFLNIIDVIVLDPSRGVVGVQVCGQDWASHIRKMTGEMADKTTRWLSTPGTVLELHGWRKVKKKRGGKAMVWRPRVAVFTLDENGISYMEAK